MRKIISSRLDPSNQASHRDFHCDGGAAMTMVVASYTISLSCGTLRACSSLPSGWALCHGGHEILFQLTADDHGVDLFVCHC